MGQAQPVSPPQPKKSHKGSITGFVLAVVSLSLSAAGSGLIHAKYVPVPTNGSAEKAVGNVVASGTTTFLTTIFGMPLLVGGIALALLSVLFVILRLRKVRVGGLVFSVFAIVLAVWSFKIATAAFSLLKAHS